MSTHIVNVNQPIVKNEIKTVRKWGDGLGVLSPKSMNDKKVLNIPEFSLTDLMKEYELYNREVYNWDALTPVGREVF